MAEKINLRSSKVKEQKRRVSEYGTETPLSSAGVDRGTTRWLNGSNVVIEGLLDVTGTTQISGRLDVSGATTLSGVTTIAGPTGITGALTIQGATTISGKLDVTGPTKLAGTLDITGNTNITGTLGIKGDTTLTGNMDVTGGGKIKIGTNMTLTPATDGGAITFQGGAKVSSVGGTVSMSGAGGVSSIVAGLTSVGISSGDAHYVAFNDGSWDMGTASKGIASTATGLQVRGTLDVAGAMTVAGATFNAKTIVAEKLRVTAASGTAAAANVYMDASGNLFRTTWTP